jgi:predicted nucleic acid-binding protein
VVSFCLDGIALAKRYVPESGSALVDFVLDQVAEHRIYILIVRHAINATDAIVLRVALDIAQYLRSGGDDLVLVASDLRLLRAAQAEGLLTFNPESKDQAALAVLVGQ